MRKFTSAKLSISFFILCQWLAHGSLAAASNVNPSFTPCFDASSTTLRGEGLLSHMVHFWDADGEIPIPDFDNAHTLSEASQEHLFTPLENSGERASLTHAQSNHWFRFCVTNSTPDTLNLVAAFAPASLSEVDFFPQKLGLQSFKTGSTKVMSTRDIPNIHFDFNVRLAAGETQSFYLRVNTVDTPFIEAKLWDRSSYDHQKNLDESQWGMYVGVFAGLVIYHLLLFLSARQTVSLFFIVWTISAFTLLSSLDGRLVQYFFPNYPRLNLLAVDITYPLSILITGLLFRKFLDLKRYPKLDLVAKGLLGLAAGALVFAYSHSPMAYAKTMDLIAVLTTSFIGLVVPIYAIIRDRLDVAKYLMVSISPLILVLLDHTLFNLEITADYLLPYDLDVAAICAMIMISYYIGLVAYREKQAAQRDAIKQLNITNTLRSNYNAQLEEELEQKTADIRSMNIDLEQQAAKLVQLDESKSKFFANISHEFRTPLTLIEGPLTMLVDSSDDDEVVTKKATLEGLIKHSRSLKQLIDQILLLSELDENALDLKAAKSDVVEITRTFVAQFESVCEQKGIELSFNSDLPRLTAYVDSEKLQIILNNLLSNAIKFTESSGRITVAVSSTTDGTEPVDGYSTDEYVQIVVSDTGQGIPEPEIEHVFDRYFQSASSEHSKSGIGTGIGLALVKELVELHAGTVDVESVYQSDAPAKGSSLAKGSYQTGTQFCITLPLGRAHLSDNEIVSEPSVESALFETPAPMTGAVDSDSNSLSADSSPAPDGERPCLLVVDDNADMRQHLSQLLHADFHIITAADGLLAEAALNEQLPALIITDLMMPNRSGLEFVQSIKKQPKFANIPIIMLTARAGLHDRIEGLMAAVDDYMIKPFNGRELKARIHNLLNKQAQFNAFYQSSDNKPSVNQQTSNDASAPQQIEPQTNAFLNSIKTLVEANIMQSDFGVDELAKALHLSEATLRRRLAEQAKFTPAAFIRHCRLEKARQLVDNAQVSSLTELAHSVGFKNPVYFARLYRKTFNCDIDVSKVKSTPN